MSSPFSHPDLVKVTELFLIPSSFLVAALGTADSNPHRAAVSVLGFVASLLWLVAVRDAHRALVAERNPGDEIPIRTRVLGWLPLVFGVSWIISAIVHICLWSKPLGKY